MAHSSLRAHKKLFRLCDELGIEQPHAVGYLVHLWWSAYEGAKIRWDGALPRWTDKDVARCSMWKGDAKVFVEGLVAAGFLDRSQDGCTVSIHNYEAWAPEFVKKRWERIGWIRPERRKRLPTAADGCQRLPTAANGGITQPNPTQRNPNEPKGKLPRSTGRASPPPDHIPGLKKKVLEQAETIYKAYPKHVGHGRAILAIKRALKSQHHEKLLEAATAYAKTVEHLKGTDDWQFVPHPATWFRAERYNDEPDPKAAENPIFAELRARDEARAKEQEQKRG